MSHTTDAARKEIADAKLILPAGCGTLADAAKTLHDAHQYALGQLEQAVELLKAAKEQRDEARAALREAIDAHTGDNPVVGLGYTNEMMDRWRKAAGEGE